MTVTESMAQPHPLSPYDAVLLLSFGGPEAPDEVMPFLRNVTRGRDIPDQRLAVVAEHYLHFGGRSPINEANRVLLAQLRSTLAASAVDVPVYWGNRNWQPYVVDALRQAHTDGARRVLTVVTSAYPSYSGCRQYREDLAGALIELAAEQRGLRVDKIRHYCDQVGFVAPVAEAVADGVRRLPDGSRVIFVTHSIPIAMDDSSGPDGGAYTASHRATCTTVMEQVTALIGRPIGWDLVYCSRSGPPAQPWLQPDINDHLVTMCDAGVRGVVVAPVGFVSDHMEVVFDLDTEAAQTARKLDLPFVRVATSGADPRFADSLVRLLLERAAAERGERPQRPSLTGAPWHDVCPAGCCANLRAADRPAACGADWVQP